MSDFLKVTHDSLISPIDALDVLNFQLFHWVPYERLKIILNKLRQTELLLQNTHVWEKKKNVDIFVCWLTWNDAVMKTGRKRNNRAAAVTWTRAKASWECLSS